MAVFRLAFLLLGGGFLLCIGAYALSGNTVWRQRAMQIVKWAVVAGLCFFALLILRRAAVFI